MHSTRTSSGVAQDGRLEGRGCQARSRIQQRVFCSVQACNLESFLGRYDHVDEPGFWVQTANGIREMQRDHLLHRDGACQARRKVRLRWRLCRACRCERVDTSCFAMLVALACSEICLHLSALLPNLLTGFSHFFLPLPPLPLLPLFEREPLPLLCRSWLTLTCTASTCIAFGSVHVLRALLRWWSRYGVTGTSPVDWYSCHASTKNSVGVPCLHKKFRVWWHRLWAWPTLAKPTLANFSVSVFLLNFLVVLFLWCCCVVLLCCCTQHPKTQTLNLGEGADPSGPTLRAPLVLGLALLFMVVVVVAGLDFPGPPSAGPPSTGPPPPDRPKFHFFFSLPPPFRSFCVSLGVFS